MIVTIDGPAGAGKSSAAKKLAEKLGFRFLDTGAMYRAVTYAARRRGVELADQTALAEVAQTVEIQLDRCRVLIDNEDVTDAIRTFEITTLTQYAADNPTVRERLTQLQREFADATSIVTEGRDQATVVFPSAECKIFLTASEEARARRRYHDLKGRGEQVDYQSVLEKQRLRDQQDQDRVHGGLSLAADSIEVHTDDLTPEQVVEELERLVRQRM